MTRRIHVGGVAIGSGADISVQSMTNTDTRDAAATIAQIRRLARAGCDIVRLAVPDEQAARVLGEIRAQSPVPLVADIHFNYRLALLSVQAGMDKIRINPGNIENPAHIRQVADACRERGIPIRIGVNGGSLSKDMLARYGGPTAQALAASALAQADMLEKFNFFDICVSLKASKVPVTVEACRIFSEKSDIPLHLGVTETGLPPAGLLKSAVGIGGLLCMGIGDTIRVSLTADPEEEVKAGIAILQAAGIRRAKTEIIACPTCGRTRTDVAGLARAVETRLAAVSHPVTVAVMGCMVNGPGEAREADWGITGGEGKGVLFRRGEIVGTFPEEALLDELIRRIEGEAGYEAV